MLHIGSNMIIFHSRSISATFLRWIFRGCFEFFVFMYKSKSGNRRVLSHTKWTSTNSIWTNCCEFVDDDLELGFLFNFFQQIPFRLRKSRSNLEFTPLRKAVTFLLQTGVVVVVPGLFRRIFRKIRHWWTFWMRSTYANFFTMFDHGIRFFIVISGVKIAEETGRS